jgi:hypothetical protein
MDTIYNTSLYTKKVEYDEICDDYAMFIDEEYVGSRATEREAVQVLDNQVFILLKHSS